MSIESLSYVLNITDGLSHVQKLVLLGIANHDGDGGSWPSIATLSRYAMCSPRSTRRHLRALEEAGWIRVHRQGGGTSLTRGDRRPNLYELVCCGFSTGVGERGDSQVSSRGGDGGTELCPSRGDRAVSSEPSFEPSASKDCSDDLRGEGVGGVDSLIPTWVQQRLDRLGVCGVQSTS